MRFSLLAIFGIIKRAAESTGRWLGLVLCSYLKPQRSLYITFVLHQGLEQKKNTVPADFTGFQVHADRLKVHPLEGVEPLSKIPVPIQFSGQNGGQLCDLWLTTPHGGTLSQ
jgi:hypothetical protein